MGLAMISASGSVQETRKARLKQLMIELHGVKHGNFDLASGQKSKIYFNTKTITLNPEGISIIAEEFLDRIRGLDIHSIGGLETGAIPIATAVAQLSYKKGKPIPAFWVRDVQKTHGDLTQVEGVLEANSKIVIVDDVATKGTSIQKVVDEANNRNCRIEKIIVLLDREEGGREKFKNYNYDAILTESEFIREKSANN